MQWGRDLKSLAASMSIVALVSSPLRGAELDNGAEPDAFPFAFRHFEITGTTKPPGAALPTTSRLDELVRRSEAVGRKAERSVCKC